VAYQSKAFILQQIYLAARAQHRGFLNQHSVYASFESQNQQPHTKITIHNPMTRIADHDTGLSAPLKILLKLLQLPPPIHFFNYKLIFNRGKNSPREVKDP